MARIAQNTTDPTRLLVPVFLRDPTGARWTGSMATGVITFTQAAGGAVNTRTLISRGSGRYEMQLVAADVTTAGNGWVDVISSISLWLDFSDAVEIY